jgi:predicted secreted protein
MRRSWAFFLVVLVIMTAPRTSFADNADPHNRVAFTVQVETELTNDLAETVLAAQAEHHNPAQVAEDINAAMAWALRQVHGVADVTAVNGAYQTYPIYDKTRLDHWRGTQTLVLRSKHIEALNKLIGTLQQRLQVQSMRFTASPKQRQAGEAQLVDQALARFKSRALRIQQQLGATGYDIVNLKLETVGARLPIPLEHLAMARAASGAPVAAEAGTSRLSLNLTAAIQLHF